MSTNGQEQTQSNATPGDIGIGGQRYEFLEQLEFLTEQRFIRGAEFEAEVRKKMPKTMKARSKDKRRVWIEMLINTSLEVLRERNESGELKRQAIKFVFQGFR